MKNLSGNKLEKLVFGMFDQMVEGADKYVTKQGSTWLIFTESKKWVIEFTKDKTLWFNFNLFQGELDLIGKDCVEERDLIKNWFESRFLNKTKLDETLDNAANMIHHIEDAIENGVKESHHVDVMKFFDKKMENTIENGVKDTYHFQTEIPNQVEDAIQEGVKHTWKNSIIFDLEGEDAIQNGVKHTRHWTRNHLDSLEDTIQNGVKDTKENWSASKYQVEDTIQNGVKDTLTGWYLSDKAVEDTIQNGVKDTQCDERSYPEWVEDTIQNGVKETTPSGYLGSIEMKGKIVHQIESPKQNNEVEDTIQNGVKETKENRLIRTISLISTINNGVKETKKSMLESLEQIYHQVTNCEITESINDTIENGVKETKEISNISLMSEIFKVNAKQAIRDGVKELKELPDKSGEFRGYGDWYRRQGHKTKPHTEYVKEVIEDSYNHMGRVEGVIRNTDKDGI